MFLFLYYRSGSRLREVFDVHASQPCLPLSHSLETCLLQAKGSPTLTPLTAMRVSFVFPQCARMEDPGWEILPSGQGVAETEIETFSWASEEKVGPIRLQEQPDAWWGELGLLLLILGEVWDWGAFPGIGGAGEFPGRGHSVSVESLGPGPQKQEQEAGLDKALGMVWLEDVLWYRWGKVRLGEIETPPSTQ